jgi:hypothetical protein
MVVEGLRGDVGFVGPGDRRSLYEELAEELGIPKRLKDPSEVEEIREVDVSGKAVGEAQMHLIAIEWLGFDQPWR